MAWREAIRVRTAGNGEQGGAEPGAGRVQDSREDPTTREALERLVDQFSAALSGSHSAGVVAA
ncbi:hypothetical protein JK364_02180 [Streptomyces sp. 110]|uniref:Uncharacterized protein n=1 Tax=Streptomyces endocoffeicus TaxID=2898945 RepID=A0ABS1PG07_9ACTN|nr:hypothetical protein [Streptomyces endocoffeicus]MBL1111224.1 hypothetical protein [Streptomyces endocoffeicus]